MSADSIDISLEYGIQKTRFDRKKSTDSSSKKQEHIKASAIKTRVPDTHAQSGTRTYAAGELLCHVY